MTELNQIAEPPRLELDSLVGDSASTDALARLKQAADRKARGGATLSAKAQAKQRKSLILLKSGLQALARADYIEASTTILSVLELDERNPLAWHMLAIALEKQGELGKAFSAYEAAVKLAPDEVAVAHDLGRLAHRLGQLEIAEKLLARFLSRNPGDEEATNNLACVLRDQNRYGEAIELLRGILEVFPERPILWNALGTVLSESGDMAGSMVFYDEALRLEPGFYKARYNRANCLVGLGQPGQALTDMETALEGLTDRHELAIIGMAKALTQLLVGDLVGGFETYEIRFDKCLDGVVNFAEFGRRWAPGDDLRGRTLLVYGEQGLGDEVLFSNPLNDVLDAIGPDGSLILAVEHRLVPLFQRSFPRATVVPHRSVGHMGAFYRTAALPDPQPDIDFWTPMGSLFRVFRTDPTAFPKDGALLKADPDRIACWRGVLDELGPMMKVGIIWKSLLMKGGRARNFTPFEYWRNLLETEGVLFVNLQYGDCSQEIAEAEAAGLNVWTPPGVDLKVDLEEVAALSSALDLFIGPMTATTNIAAGCGARAWVISTPDAWPRFGERNFPCYPSVEVFEAERFGDWEGPMQRITESLRSELVAGQRQAPLAS